MKKPILLAISMMITISFVTHSPIFADDTTACAPTAQCDDCTEDEDCDDSDDCEVPCVPWSSWYCGMSYAVIGLGVAAVAAVAAIVLASGDSSH